MNFFLGMKEIYITITALNGGHLETGTMLENTVLIKIESLSNRTPYLTDANGNSVEGGALNANYTLVDAVASVCNKLGKAGFTYRKDFVWDDQSWTEDMDEAISLKYNDSKILTVLGLTR